jgi:hypothetical protein
MKPFLHGKKSLTLPALHVPSPLNGAPPRKPAAPGPELTEVPPAPTVEVIKEGDKVVRLLVTCGCGQKIEVDCLYPAGT